MKKLWKLTVYPKKDLLSTEHPFRYMNLKVTFPQREEPSVGAVVHEPPKQVRIWFDAKLESAFSTLVIKDSDGNKISAASQVDPESQQRLEAQLPALAPGEYHVYWKVVSWDGHHSKGDYTFTVKP